MRDTLLMSTSMIAMTMAYLQSLATVIHCASA